MFDYEPTLDPYDSYGLGSEEGEEELEGELEEEEQETKFYYYQIVSLETRNFILRLFTKSRHQCRKALGKISYFTSIAYEKNQLNSLLSHYCKSSAYDTLADLLETKGSNYTNRLGAIFTLVKENRYRLDTKQLRF